MQEEKFLVNKMEKAKIQKGQTLIEVVAALVIVSIILAGVVRVVVVSLKNMEFSRNQNFSLNLAQTKVEELRAERDSTNWEVFWKKYLETLPNPQVEPDLGQGGAFTRKTFFEGEGDNKMKIIVNVSWEDSLGTHVSSISSYLTKWK